MLDLLFRPRRRGNANNEDKGWPSGRVGTRTLAGVKMSEDLALTLSALWSGTRLLAETTAGLPAFLYRRLGNDNREVAADLPLFDLVHNSPNPTMGSTVFREGRTYHQVLWGNGFAEIERDGRTDEPIAEWPIHPSRVRPVRPNDRNANGQSLANAGYAYMVSNNDGSAVALRSEEMLHVAGALSDDGIWGKSVVAYGRNSLGLNAAQEHHAAAFFGSGGQPKAVLFLPGMKDKDVRNEFRAEWKTVHGSPDSLELAILPPDGRYEQLSLNNVDSQFLESRQFSVLEIARWLRVPPHLLMDLQSGASYASIEMMSLEYVLYGLLPWVRRWEEQLNLKLLTPEQRKTLFFEFQLAGLLRGDMKSRMEAYRLAIMIGIMTINEARRLENMNGIGPAGDVHYVPLNMTTAERMMLGLDKPNETAVGSDHTGAPGDRNALASKMFEAFVGGAVQ